MRPLPYPFSAIVGQESMKTALLLNAVDPSIGGALIRGHKGTGKSTAARALAAILPRIEVVRGCPFNSDPQSPVDLRGMDVGSNLRRRPNKPVLRRTPFIELPLNATEDRLVGSLHIEEALRTGKRAFEPGILAAANRGILYVDEVNLLDDHLVDMLLDAAASGINVVEREGISFTHPARFILIGTMNPEEGDLRPQFLDRFGLCAAVESIDDPEARQAIVRRHLGFEADPDGFAREWRQSDSRISRQIVLARERLGCVEIPEHETSFAVGLTRSLLVQGHRADITILKAARAHAALLEKSRIDDEDVAEAARLAVPHRMKAAPLESMDSLRQRIDRTLAELGRSRNDSAKPEGQDASPEEMAEMIQVPGSMAAGSILFTFLSGKEKETVFEADADIGSVDIDVEGLVHDGNVARRASRAKTSARSGRYHGVSEVEDGERDYDLALDSTLRQAARRCARGASSGNRPLTLKREDLRKKRYERPCDTLIVFVVDSSDSMGSGAVARMKAAKGAILAILRNAYRSRSRVAMVAFGGEKASVVLPPTSSMDRARRLLETLPTGGATPFADGLQRAWQIIRSERLKRPAVRTVMVIVSDGDANVPVLEGAPPLEELGELAEKIGGDGIPTVLIDAADNAKRSEMRQIAGRMRASYVRMRDLTPSGLLKAARLTS